MFGCRSCADWRVVVLVVVLAACAGPTPDPEPEIVIENWIRHPTGSLPPRLSQIGAFDSLAEDLPTPDVRAFEVRYPRFSDGLPSRRWLFVPEDAQVDTGAMAWSFPVGTLAIKTFYRSAAPRSPIETRVIFRGEAEWQAGTYLWDDSRTDALLLEGRSDTEVELDGEPGRHVIPKTLSCRSCHQHGDGWLLGFNALQLAAETEDGSDQLEDFALQGVFSPSSAPETVTINARSELEREVLGYLQGNCASCHRPGTAAYNTTELDLRHAEALEHTVDKRPIRLGTTDPDMRLVAPLQPDKSLLYILTTGSYPDPAMFMPQLGTRAIDTPATDRLREWIDSL